MDDQYGNQNQILKDLQANIKTEMTRMQEQIDDKTNQANLIKNDIRNEKFKMETLKKKKKISFA